MFLQTCTKPVVVHKYTDTEVSEYQATKEFPSSLEEVDRDEQADKKNVPQPEKGEKNWMWKRGKWTRQITLEVYDKIAKLLTDIIGSPVVVRGVFYYPPGGYRVWHSNQYDPHGWRLYMVHTNGGESAFNYLADGKVVSMPDKDGIVNAFKVGDGKDILYHSVHSDTADRWSLGFLVEDPKAVEKLLKR